MNILPQTGATAREIAAEVLSRARQYRYRIAVGIHDCGTVQMSPACKPEGERLLLSDSAVGTYNARSSEADITAAVLDRIFVILTTRLRAARAA